MSKLKLFILVAVRPLCCQVRNWILFCRLYIKLSSRILQAEVTFEANPDDLVSEKLTDLKKLGINRLSIGIQSFDDSILKFLNRVHDARLAITNF